MFHICKHKVNIIGSLLLSSVKPLRNLHQESQNSPPKSSGGAISATEMSNHALARQFGRKTIKLKHSMPSSSGHKDKRSWWVDIIPLNGKVNC